jgi:hypothetical protein
MMPFFLLCEAAILTYLVSHLTVYLLSALTTNIVPMLFPVSILLLLASYVAAGITIEGKHGELPPYPSGVTLNIDIQPQNDWVGEPDFGDVWILSYPDNNTHIKILSAFTASPIALVHLSCIIDSDMSPADATTLAEYVVSGNLSFDWTVDFPDYALSGNNAAQFRLVVRNHTSRDYTHIRGDWQATSHEFSFKLDANPAASRSSRVEAATSLASQTSDATTSTGSAGSSSPSDTPFTQSDSSNEPEVSQLSGAPTLGPAPSQDPASRNNTGVIAGGVVGGLLLLAIIIGAILLLLKRRRKKEKKTRLVGKDKKEMAKRKVNDGKFVPQADLPEWVDSDHRT